MNIKQLFISVALGAVGVCAQAIPAPTGYSSSISLTPAQLKIGHHYGDDAMFIADVVAPGCTGSMWIKRSDPIYPAVFSRLVQLQAQGVAPQVYLKFDSTAAVGNCRITMVRY